MSGKILNDFIKDDNIELSKEFIQKTNHFISTYKSNNVHLKSLLNHIVKKGLNYSFNKDNKEIKIYAVKFTLPSYEQRDGVMISITECNTQNPQKYFLMKSCFISTEPDTFTLSDNFSKVTKEMNIIEFKKLLEQIFFVW